MKNLKLAIYDLFYGFAIWIIIRLNPRAAAELLEAWAYALKRRDPL